MSRPGFENPETSASGLMGGWIAAQQVSGAGYFCGRRPVPSRAGHCFKDSSRRRKNLQRDYADKACTG